MTGKKHRTPITVKLLIGILFFQGLSGISGGIGLIMDPTGKSLQIPLEWLEGSIFSSYLIPGIILFMVLGVFPLFVIYGIQKQKNWAWNASFVIAIGLLVWIIVEIIIIGYQSNPPLQLIYGILGIVILFLTLLPETRKHLIFRKFKQEK
jgi:uncharacterized BrkB/YihY/UPF0761 family membrane protein